MPNRDVHVPVGVVTGGVTALVTALVGEEEVTLPGLLSRVAGGMLGGYVGARAPDIFDPSSNGPNHRSWAHGVIPVSAAGSFLSDWYFTFREKRLAETKSGDTGNDILNNLIVGTVDGFGTSYLSHLALDATTPKRLPLMN